MSTNPSNTDPAYAEPLSTDPTGQDPGATDPTADVKAQLQSAIFEVTRDAEGKSLGDILELLRSAFARRGVEAPPNTWLESVASAAFYGEPYIIDLPAALAAEGAVPAPSEDVRRQLASRRQLRQETLPPGIFPAPADWDIHGDDVALAGADPGGRGHSRAVTRRARGQGAALTVAALVAAAVVVVLATRASTRHPDTKPGSSDPSTTRNGSNGQN